MSHRRIGPIVAILCMAMAVPALAATSSGIAQETIRIDSHDGHIVNFWWLPPEYWVAAARELRYEQAQIDEIRDLYRNYTLLAALDVHVKPDAAMDALSIAEIVRRAEIEVNGERFEVLRQVDPRLQKYAPDLTYFLNVSLASLGPALRLLPLRNLDAEGGSILDGGTPGLLVVRYKARAGQKPLEFWWRGPLTEVVGAKACPGSGEPMEASWLYCPWSGEKVE